MSCEQCKTRFEYNSSCLECCARLVCSARPSRFLQEGMLAFLDRQPNAPSKKEILERVKQIPKDYE